MLLNIVSHTPAWVFVLFAGLLFLGLSQILTRRVPLRRVIILPLAMAGLSGWGVISVFGGSPSMVMLWLASATALAMLVTMSRVPEGTQWDSWQQRFVVPGSFVPLVLIMGIFLTKYAVGVAMALQPGLARDLVFGLVTCSLYGAFTGVFLGRAARLLRLAMDSERAALACGTARAGV